MSKSGSQPNMEGEPSLEEFGHSGEVAATIPSPTLGYITLFDYQSGEELIEPIEFTNLKRWKAICFKRYERLVERATTMGTDYMVFIKVGEDDLRKIDRSHLDFQMRIFYDSTVELLIVKLMAGKAHEWVGNLFADYLRQKAQSRCGDPRALKLMGAFRHMSTTRSKEPDVALVPRGRNRELDWSSVVIEVGVSEHLAALRSDAQFWICDSGGSTRVVLLIAVDTQTRVIVIERWGDVPPTYPSHAVGPNFRPRKIQSVTIDIGTNLVVGAPLDVPSDLVFDIGNVPTGVLVTDFSFDATELLGFSTEFWESLS